MDHISSVQVMERTMLDLSSSTGAKHHLQIPERPRWRKSCHHKGKANLKHILCQMKFRYPCPKCESICFAIQNVCTDFQFDLNGIRTAFQILFCCACELQVGCRLLLCRRGTTLTVSKRLASFLLTCAIRQSYHFACIVHWRVMIAISPPYKYAVKQYTEATLNN